MPKLPDYRQYELAARYCAEHPPAEIHHPDLWPAINPGGEIMCAPGDLVFVWAAGGVFRPAVVVKLGRDRVAVAYTIPGAGGRLIRRTVRPVDALQVRPGPAVVR